MLTEAQHRALEVGLGRIEMALAWMEELLGWTYAGVVVSFVDNRGSQRRQLRTQIGEARRLPQWLRDEVGLRPDQVPKSSRIVGHLAHLRVVAEECQSRYLRGYGKVGADLSVRLDSGAQRLAELLVAMQRVAGICLKHVRHDADRTDRDPRALPPDPGILDWLNRIPRIGHA